MILAVLALPLLADGAVVVLKNGDRLSGIILDRDDTSIRLESPVFGTLSVPRAQVERIEEEVPGEATTAGATTDVPVIQKQGDNVGTATEELAEAAAVTGVNEEQLQEAVDTKKAEKSLERVLQGLPLLGPALRWMADSQWVELWETHITGGMTLRTGRADSSNFNFLLWTERKYRQNEVRIEAAREYELTLNEDGSKTVTRNRTRGLLRFRFNMNDYLFVQSSTQYSNARANGIDHDLRESVGIGWRYLRSDRLKGSITPSIAAQYQEVNGESEGISMVPTLSQDLVYNLNERITFREEANALFPISGDQKPTWGFLLRMETKLLSNLSFNIEYDFDYDGAVGVDAEASQSSILARVGVTF